MRPQGAIVFGLLFLSLRAGHSDAGHNSEHNTDRRASAMATIDAVMKGQTVAVTAERLRIYATHAARNRKSAGWKWALVSRLRKTRIDESTSGDVKPLPDFATPADLDNASATA